MAAPQTTILLADDNDDSLEIYGTLFEHCGYRVAKATDGPAAIEAARRERPALVLLNLFMPGMSGQEVLRALREDPETADVRCLMLTGDVRPEQMGEALIGGADAYLTKPVEPRHVLEIVESILDEEC